MSATAALGALAVLGSIGNTIATDSRARNEQIRADEYLRDLYFNPNDFKAEYKYLSDPLLENVYQQSNTEYDNVRVDPSVLYAQNRALDDLINLSESKGLNAIDQQALQEIISNENRNLQGQNEAILQDAMQRGVYGSGLEMAQRLQAAQSSANRMNNQDMDVMSQAQQRALEALSNYGNLASNMRTQDFNEQSKRAEAQDTINQYNIGNMIDSNRNNINRQNEVSQKNVGIYNQQQDSNVDSADRMLTHKETKAGLGTGQAQANINSINQSGDRWNSLIGNTAISVGSALDNADSNKKKENQ